MSERMKEVVLGIDLGTTLSEAAIYEADGKVKVLPNADGELLTPSVVNLGDEDHPVVGTAAVHQMAFAPEHTVRLVKRSMGKFDAQGNPVTVFIHPDSGKTYVPEQISSMILRYLVESVEAGLGVKVVGVVITVPAYFADSARMATKRAGELAGLYVLSVINEPTAAALAFGMDGDEAGVFAVYDLGGGTFDISILEICGKDFTVLATDGDRDLGGSDVDNLILDRALEAFKAQYGIEITPESDLPAHLEISGKCEAAKKALSRTDTASFLMSAQGQRLVFELNRTDFNTLISPLVEKTRVITERALAAAHLKPADIKDVILVGGSSRIPLVRDMLTSLFGKAPRTDTAPDEAVALGAAIYAARLGVDKGLGPVDGNGNKVLGPILHMAEVTAHGVGCVALVGNVPLNCVIIPPNTPLPATKEDTFSLLVDNQKDVLIEIAQGPDHTPPSECAMHGTLEFNDLPPGTRENRIRIQYSLTAEGTLDICAVDTISGKRVTDVKHGLNGQIKKGS